VGKKPKSGQSGQAIVEYILLLSIVIGMLSVFLAKFTSTFDTATIGLGGKMEVQMRTGRAPATLWTK
jgi:hypothetical protein